MSSKTTSKGLADLLTLSTMTLATTSPVGEPHAAPIYFAALWENDLRTAPFLYFFSDPKSRHCRDLASNPAAAAAIYPEATTWREILGLQLHGMARPVRTGQEWESAWDAYRAKFPFVTSLKALVDQNALYLFQPRWVRLVDNRRGFGYKEEWEYP